MKIIQATQKYSKQISELMLKDLENPNPKFPDEMIQKFRKHAREESVKKEFGNPNLIAFLAIDNKNILGFIVGYKQEKEAMIHYLIADSIQTKKQLLDIFINHCKQEEITQVITDSFEFMENNKFFKNQGFKLTKTEKITPNLKMLWYEFKTGVEI